MTKFAQSEDDQSRLTPEQQQQRKREVIRRLLTRQLGEEPTEEQIDLELENRRQLSPEEDWRQWGEEVAEERRQEEIRRPRTQEEQDQKKREIIKERIRRETGEEPTEERIDIELENFDPNAPRTPEQIERERNRIDQEDIGAYEQWSETAFDVDEDQADPDADLFEEEPQQEEQEADLSYSGEPLLEQLGSVNQFVEDTVAELTQLRASYESGIEEIKDLIEEDFEDYAKSIDDTLTENALPALSDAIDGLQAFARTSGTIASQTKTYLDPSGGAKGFFSELSDSLSEWYRTKRLGLPSNRKREEQRQDRIDPRDIDTMMPDQSQRDRRRRDQLLKERIKQRKREQERAVRKRQQMEEQQLVSSSLVVAQISVTPDEQERRRQEQEAQKKAEKIKTTISTTLQRLNQETRDTAGKIEQIVKEYFDSNGSLMGASQYEIDKMKRGLTENSDQFKQRSELFSKMFGNATSGGTYVHMGYSALSEALKNLQQAANELGSLEDQLPVELGGKDASPGPSTADKINQKLMQNDSDDDAELFEDNESPDIEEATPQAGDSLKRDQKPGNSVEGEVNTLQRRLAERARQRRRRQLRQLSAQSRATNGGTQ